MYTEFIVISVILFSLCYEIQQNCLISGEERERIWGIGGPHAVDLALCLLFLDFKELKTFFLKILTVYFPNQRKAHTKKDVQKH